MSFVQGLKDLNLGGDRKSLSMMERETIYSAGFGLYEVGDYEGAADLFTQLIFNEPYDLRFWKGLASARQMQREYKAALHAWSIACLLGGHQPISHFHAAECYLSLGELKEAAKAIECAQFHLRNEQSPLSKRIEELKKVVVNG